MSLEKLQARSDYRGIFGSALESIGQALRQPNIVHVQGRTARGISNEDMLLLYKHIIKDLDLKTVQAEWSEKYNILWIKAGEKSE